MPAKRLAGISRFAAKPGFFPQKALFTHLCTHGKRNCPSAISTPRLGLSDNPPAGLSRECACRWRQRKKRPCALQPHEEKQISSQPVRRRRKTLTAFFAWRREIKKRFCRLLGLWPKGGGRGHPCEGSTILFAAKPRRKSLFSRSAAAAGLQNRAAGYAAASNTTQQGR